MEGSFDTEWFKIARHAVEELNVSFSCASKLDQDYQ